MKKKKYFRNDTSWVLVNFINGFLLPTDVCVAKIKKVRRKTNTRDYNCTFDGGACV